MSILLQAQGLPEADFENWTEINGYEEPGGPTQEFWGTNNKLSLLGGGPLTTFKETEDVYAGQYSVRLVSTLWDLQPQPLGIPAILASGFFEANIADVTQSFRLGRPWSSRPSRFKGYYKYLPQGGDQCAIYARLTRYNESTGLQDTIGEASLSVFDTMADYAAFDLEIEYRSEETPDTITIVFTPSAYGQDFQIGENSTLLIDDVSLSYGGVDIAIVGENQSLQTYPNPSTGAFRLRGNISNFDKISIYDQSGQLVKTQSIMPNQDAFDFSTLASGQYIFSLSGPSSSKYNGLLTISK